MYIDFRKRFMFLVLSLLINATGHALTISTNLGSAVWTASAVNINNCFSINSLSLVIFLEGLAVNYLVSLIDKKRKISKFLLDLLFITPFSILVQYFTNCLEGLNLQHQLLLIRIVLDILGIVFISLATSLYQRANIVLHPNDDFMQTIRFMFLHGDATKAQIIHFLVPLSIIVITTVISHAIWAVGIGTIISFFFQGSMIKWFDIHAFKHLKHYDI